MRTNVEPKHRSREFIDLLKRLDTHYPNDAVIRVVLDNHSAHISKVVLQIKAAKIICSGCDKITFVMVP